MTEERSIREELQRLRERYPAAMGVATAYVVIIALLMVVPLGGWVIDEVSGAEPVHWGQVGERTGPCKGFGANWTDGTCYTEAQNLVGGAGFPMMVLAPFLFAGTYAYDVGRRLD